MMRSVPRSTASPQGWLARQRALLGFAPPGYQLEVAAIDRYERLIDFAPLHPAKAHNYSEQIRRIRKAFANRTYDFARAELSQLRAEFCRELPLYTVCGEVIEDILDDLDYLDARSAESKRAELGQLRVQLMEKLCGNGAVNEVALRVRLRALSQVAAQAHDAYWLKVNLTRNRLAVMGIAVALALLGVLIILPPGMRSGLRHGGDLRERYLWLILMFGALGGLISAIMDSESIDTRDTRASEYYIYRRLLYLRPLIGAALALVVYLALVGKLIAIKGLGATPLDPSFLVIAFSSGFAERAFVPQLLKVAVGADSDHAMKPHNRRKELNHAV
jgi:hypothetical protein